MVIPTYNRYELLKNALLSILLQSRPPAEVILISDGCTDKTPVLVQHFQPLFVQRKIRFSYIQIQNSGVSHARNIGIKKTKSPWVAFLDSDDQWNPNKLEAHWTSLTESFTSSFKKESFFISHSLEIWIYFNQIKKQNTKFLRREGNIFSSCLDDCKISPSTCLIHKNVFKQIGLFNEKLKTCEDYEFWLRALDKFNVHLCEKKLITKYFGEHDQLSATNLEPQRKKIRTDLLNNYIFSSAYKKTLLGDFNNL